MSGKLAKSPETNALVKKSLYLSHFTPSMMPPETLEAMLVQREPVLSRCLASVVESLRTGSRHHTLFVGPRGIGKTHLISLLHHRLSQTKEAKSKALIAWMREEEWGVTSFFELVLRILRTLDASYPALNIEAQAVAVYDLPLNEAEKKAESILIEVLADKCLVVLLENLDDLFEQLGDQGQKAWRAFIQNHSNTILVCTTPSLFTGITIQKSAFYGFFDVEPLTELSYEDVVNLLEKIAIERDDEPLAAYIQTPEGRARIRAVHHLAEGNPRIYIIFAQFLTQESLDDLVQAFMHTLDELTPYYQARIKELPGQQRKILEHLINHTGATSVKLIAKSCFITQQVCSSQLRQLRLKRYVRVIEQGRESYYELCEPLMRLCMDIKKQRGEPVSLLVEMLRIWYTEDQLTEWLEQPYGEFSLSISYIQLALRLQKTQSMEPEVEAILKDLTASGTESGQKSLVREFIKLKTKNVLAQQFQSVARLASDEIQSINTLTEYEIKENILNVERLIRENFPSITNSNVAYTVLGPLLAISLRVFKRDRDQAKPLFDALIPEITRFPAAFSVAVLDAMVSQLEVGTDWLDALLGRHSGEFSSEEIATTNERLSRIWEALRERVVSNSRASLLSLPKEERDLVEQLANKYLNTKK
jgi:DNA polymerase III delta prime subunit